MAAFQAVPKVAAVPLLLLFAEVSHVALLTSVLLGFYPVFVGTLRGIDQVSQDAIDLFRVHRATTLQELFRLRLPSAVPFALPGVHTAALYSMLGVITVEVVRPKYGIGYLVAATESWPNKSMLFAAVTAATLMGVAWWLLVIGITGRVARRYLRRGQST